MFRNCTDLIRRIKQTNKKEVKNRFVCVFHRNPFDWWKSILHKMAKKKLHTKCLQMIVTVGFFFVFFRIVRFKQPKSSVNVVIKIKLDTHLFLFIACTRLMCCWLLFFSLLLDHHQQQYHICHILLHYSMGKWFHLKTKTNNNNQKKTVYVRFSSIAPVYSSFFFFVKQSSNYTFLSL